MRRRELLSLLGYAAVAHPLTVWAQNSGKPKIGVLIVANAEPFSTLFRQELQKLGYVDGQNAQIEIRSAGGKPAVLADLAAELVSLKVDLIVVNQTPAVEAAHRATSNIPIVMSPAADPVAAGLVASLAHPGGNITGLSFTSPELQGKNLELMREVLPSIRRVMFLGNALDAMVNSFYDQLQTAGRSLGIETQSITIHGVEELEQAFDAIGNQAIDAMMVQPSIPRKAVIDLALKYRLPAFSPNKQFAEEGGLLSYAGSLADVYRKAAFYVDKILKGARPFDLPVEQPTVFELVINLKTAKALGLNIPPTLLARADEVIE